VHVLPVGQSDCAEQTWTSPVPVQPPPAPPSAPASEAPPSPAPSQTTPVPPFWTRLFAVQFGSGVGPPVTPCRQHAPGAPFAAQSDVWPHSIAIAPVPFVHAAPKAAQT
jgi:hypothetical protein